MSFSIAVAGVLLAVVRAEAILARGARTAGSSTGLFSHCDLLENVPLQV